MKKLSAALFMVVLAITSIGCDSNGGDDETSIADLIADGWALTSLEDAEGDQTAVFLTGFDGVDVTFTESGNFTLDVDRKAPNPDTQVTGTWAVNESQSRLTLTTDYQGIPVDLIFTYMFNGDDEIELTAASSTGILLNTLLGTTLQGTITITIQRS